MRANLELVFGVSLLAVLLLIGTTTVEAQQVTVLDLAHNVAQLGTATTFVSPNWTAVPAVLDNRVSHGTPGGATKSQFYDYVHYIGFSSTIPLTGPFQIDLDWAGSTYNLTSLQAYVCSGDLWEGPLDADRVVASIDFYVDYGLGGGFEFVSNVVTDDTDNIGGFDLTKTDGAWNNVAKVRYQFNIPTGGTQRPRVAEIMAISPDVNIAPKGASGLVLNGGGLALTEQGGTMVAANNVALASKGAVAFGTTPYPDPAHTIAHANDGVYGNANSWLAYNDNADGKSFIGVKLGGKFDIDSVAFGRDNTAGGYSERWASTFFYETGYDEELKLQYTRVADPTETTPDADWTDIGTLDYIVPGGTNFDQAALRHRFTFDEVKGVTGVRLVVPFAYNSITPGHTAKDLWRANAIDEFEVYGEASAGVVIPGDTDGDLVVDADDAEVVARHWGQAAEPGDYKVGNFNDDHVVNAADASIMAANWGDHNESASSGSVPEPTSLGLLISAAVAALLVRRRRHGQS